MVRINYYRRLLISFVLILSPLVGVVGWHGQ